MKLPRMTSSASFKWQKSKTLFRASPSDDNITSVSTSDAVTSLTRGRSGGQVGAEDSIRISRNRSHKHHPSFEFNEKFAKSRRRLTLARPWFALDFSAFRRKRAPAAASDGAAESIAGVPYLGSSDDDSEAGSGKYRTGMGNSGNSGSLGNSGCSGSSGNSGNLGNVGNSGSSGNSGKSNSGKGSAGSPGMIKMRSNQALPEAASRSHSLVSLLSGKHSSSVSPQELYEVRSSVM